MDGGDEMNSQLFAEIEKAIERAVVSHGDEPLWDCYIYETLFRDMAQAAAIVFDASASGQEFLKRELK
jgi:hypothetical protein